MNLDLHYVAMVLQQAQQTLEAMDASLRAHVPERYRRMVMGANCLGEVAGIVDRCRGDVLLAIQETGPEVKP